VFLVAKTFILLNNFLGKNKIYNYSVVNILKWYSSFKLNVDTEMVDYKIQFFIFRYLRVSFT